MTHKKLNTGQQADLVDKMKKNIKSAMDKAEEEGKFDVNEGEAAIGADSDPRVEEEGSEQKAAAAPAPATAPAAGGTGTTAGAGADVSTSNVGGGNSKKGGKKGKKGKVRVLHQTRA
jgi:hypothetical protein